MILVKAREKARVRVKVKVKEKVVEMEFKQEPAPMALGKIGQPAQLAERKQQLLLCQIAQTIPH